MMKYLFLFVLFSFKTAAQAQEGVLVTAGRATGPLASASYYGDFSGVSRALNGLTQSGAVEQMDALPAFASTQFRSSRYPVMSSDDLMAAAGVYFQPSQRVVSDSGQAFVLSTTTPYIFGSDTTIVQPWMANGLPAFANSGSLIEPGCFDACGAPVIPFSRFTTF